MTLLSNRYQIVFSLGSGGFGQTFLAKDTQLPNHPYCVVKKLWKSLPPVYRQCPICYTDFWEAY